MSRKQDYYEYLASPDWQVKKSIALKLANYRCTECNTTKRIEVHHRKYSDWENADSKKDLIVLCRNCHQDVHDYGGYVFNSKRKKSATERKRIDKLSRNDKRKETITLEQRHRDQQKRKAKKLAKAEKQNLVNKNPDQLVRFAPRVIHL